LIIVAARYCFLFPLSGSSSTTVPEVTISVERKMFLDSEGCCSSMHVSTNSRSFFVVDKILICP
jgi:hypothetical protein